MVQQNTFTLAFGNHHIRSLPLENHSSNCTVVFGLKKNYFIERKHILIRFEGEIKENFQR